MCTFGAQPCVEAGRIVIVRSWGMHMPVLPQLFNNVVGCLYEEGKNFFF